MTPQENDDTSPDAAVSAEANGDPRTLTFGTGDEAVTLTIPRKWKRFKFLRALNRGDIGAALEAIWAPVPTDDGTMETNPALVTLEEIDLDQDEFNATLERLAEALGGTAAGNS